MTKPHITDFYMDGYIAVPFCKVCSKDNPTGSCDGYVTVKEPAWMEQTRIDDDRDLRESEK